MAVFQTGTSFTYDNLMWTAPVNPTNAQKTITFYYIGNAANGDRGPGGDFIYSGIKTIGLAVNHPPAATITSPLPNSVFKAGDSIYVNVNVTDSDGVVTKVVFYNNGFKFLEDSIAPYGIISDEAEPGNYVLTAKAFDNKGDSTVSDTIRFIVTGCSGTGFTSAYGYTGITGTQVADLINHPSYPGAPAISTQLSSLEYANVGENYGARLKGYICAPQTGNYTFYIAGDDQAGLYLSTNEDTVNKRLIAYNETPVSFHEWTKFTTQKSQAIRLIKGARYYFETLHKQSTTTNHLSVGWVLPDGSAEGPIPGNRLSPWQSVPFIITGINNPAFNLGTLTSPQFIGDDHQLTIVASPNPSTSYFSLQIKSNSNEPVNITVTDITGKIVERRQQVPANGTLRLGSQLRPGVYIVEVMQDTSRKRLKLIRQ